MSGPLPWVVGAGGLLGSNVVRALAGQTWRPREAIAWNDPTAFARIAAAAVRDFAASVAGAPGQPWVVSWCAGAGVVGTSATALAAEIASFRVFLELVAASPPLATTPGLLMLASSAGGVYGGSEGRPFTDTTAPRPISDYGRAKLETEQTLANWARARPRISTLTARITNLYGPGQSLNKPQGLISHMSRCLIYGMPVHIYVPLDTIRDYLYAQDAGKRLVTAMNRLARPAGNEAIHVTKVFGSEREISIAGLIGVFRRMARRQLKVVSGLHPVGTQQPRCLQFRSNVWTGQDEPPTDLLEGISNVYRHQLALYQRGQLVSPFRPR